VGSCGGQALSGPADPDEYQGAESPASAGRSYVAPGPEFQARHEQCRTKIALVVELVEEAIRCKVPFGVVVFDAWYLAEDLVQVLARRRKDWISVLKKNRLLETASFHLRDANGWPLKLPGPQIAVEE